LPQSQGTSLAPRLQLQIPTGEVDANAVIEHEVERRLAADVETFSADRYDKLDLVEVAGLRRVRHGRPAIEDSIRRRSLMPFVILNLNQIARPQTYA
jgi:hypothetical protein